MSTSGKPNVTDLRLRTCERSIKSNFCYQYSISPRVIYASKKHNLPVHYAIEKLLMVFTRIAEPKDKACSYAVGEQPDSTERLSSVDFQGFSRDNTQVDFLHRSQTILTRNLESFLQIVLTMGSFHYVGTLCNLRRFPDIFRIGAC